MLTSIALAGSLATISRHNATMLTNACEVAHAQSEQTHDGMNMLMQQHATACSGD